ncbi:MAG: bifunctional DNA primase/polymerase [Anaerolineales bacterium]|nr:bifunctional DNA primase/polymerase [Anaerolineales bacterium]
MSVESAKQYRQLATKYRGYGFNLVPLGSDKRPAMTGIATSGGIMRFRWDDWQQTKQTDPLWAQIKKHEWWVDVAGLGGVCGPVSGDMVCIDFDTPKDRTDLVFPFELLERFLQCVGLTDSLWIVDTPRGGYVWARCAGLEIEKGKFDRPALGLDGGYHIELRWTGHYAALPESQHPNGVYQWRNDEPLTPPPAVDRDALLTAYAAVTKEPEAKTAPASVHANGNTPHTPGQGYAARRSAKSCRVFAPHPAIVMMR